ncbi:hypothetical protein HHK36_028710 [Tetracentron sinense]|uniref:STI1 domain-containing protein n=1 Tax=Tetracentron sinense TaxID=13715 RepID=A0A834YGA0_TETSI|nr:hypothetical protein HHK36_028710 [Tetracentron sinense]
MLSLLADSKKPFDSSRKRSISLRRTTFSTPIALLLMLRFTNTPMPLSDAKKTVELKPDWSKGYSRLGAAHVGLHSLDDAISAYKKGLELDPSNEALKSGLSDAQSSASRSRAPPSASPSSPFGNIFQGPELWAKLTADPSTRAFLQQPDFVKMIQDIQKNPNNLNMFLKDQRMMQVLGVLLNVKLRTATPEEMDVPEAKPEAGAESVKQPEPEPESKPEAMDVIDEKKEERERKVQAQKEKEAGNAAYKKKDFETAIQHYSKAIELDDEDISFLTNRAAVYLEMGKVWNSNLVSLVSVFLCI